MELPRNYLGKGGQTQVLLRTVVPVDFSCGKAEAVTAVSDLGAEKRVVTARMS